MTLTEEQWRIIENIVGILAGAGSSIGIQYFAKKKTKKEEKDVHTDNLLKGSGAVFDQSQELVEMLQRLLETERKNHRADIDNLKVDFTEQITSMRDEHRSQIDALIKDNDALNLRVERLVNDNHELNIQVVKLSSANDTLTKQVTTLKKRLSKYETDMSDTGDHRPVKA